MGTEKEYLIRAREGVGLSQNKNRGNKFVQWPILMS